MDSSFLFLFLVLFSLFFSSLFSSSFFPVLFSSYHAPCAHYKERNRKVFILINPNLLLLLLVSLLLLCLFIPYCLETLQISIQSCANLEPFYDSFSLLSPMFNILQMLQ